MAYLIENTKRAKELQAELATVVAEIERDLVTAKEIISRSESVGLELKYEMPDLAMWAKGALDFGFSDYEGDEASEMRNLTEDIYEYANQIEYIFSEDYQSIAH